MPRYSSTLQRARKLLVDFVQGLDDTEAEALWLELDGDPQAANRVDLWEILGTSGQQRLIKRYGLAQAIRERQQARGDFIEAFGKVQ